jgi:starch-binding outer membrane protein, SusD/RagB family
MQLKHISIALLLAALGFSSCSREDLFEEPLDAISTATAFSSPERIEKTAVGMYSALQNPNWGSGRNLIYADVQGLDVNPNPYFNNVGYFNQMRPNDATVTSAWMGAYNTIFTANLFRKNFLAVKDLVPAEKADQYLGEAAFIRAYNYFYLVNFWGQTYTDPKGPEANLGVPLVLEAAEDPFAAANLLPRATVKQVYDQIEQDLLAAEAKLPVSYSDLGATISRATKGAARGLLMRMYLYQGNWAKARDYADLLINSNNYALNATPEVTYRNYQTRERIFSVAFSGSNNPDRNNALSAHYSPTVRGDLSVSNAFLSLMDTTVDLRYKNLVMKTRQGASWVFWTTKYTNFADWAPVLRYAEVLLVKAEALARLGDAAAPADPGAVGLLNQVRTRSQAAPATPATNADLLAAVLRERRIELAFEGQAYFDLQRTHQDIPPHASILSPIPYGTTYRVWPVPQREINIMPDLAQNPGY